MKNFDDGKGTNIRIQSQEFPVSKTGETTNNLLQECDKIIAEANKNVENLTKKNSDGPQFNPRSQNSIIMLNSNSLDVGMNITGGQKNLSGNFMEGFSSEFSDIIGETENLEPLFKKAKTSKVEQPFISANIGTKLQPEPEICNEFNDSFDESEMEKNDNLARKEATTKSISPKIHLMQNIVLRRKNTSAKNNLNNEDDLFSDEDVVETTPQKVKHVSGEW